MKTSHLLFVFSLAALPVSVQAQNQPAKPAPKTAASTPDAAKPDAGKSETPREGELRLDGKITAVLGPGTWQIEAYSFTSPRGVTKDFDEIKTKTVKIAAGGFVHPRGETDEVALADVKLGSRVAVIGKNGEDGSLVAREVVLLEGYGQVRTLGQVVINGVSSALITKSREAFEGGDVGKAIALSTQALQAAQAANDLPGQAFSNNDLGLIFIRTQQYDRAREAYEKAVPLWKTAGNSQSQAIALNGLAGAYLGLQQPEKALPPAQEAETLSKGAPMLRESVLRRLSVVYEALGKQDEAIAMLEQLAPVADGVGDHDVAIGTFLEIAEMTAKSTPDRAKKALGEVDTRLPQLKDAKTKVALGISAAGLWWALGDQDGAMARLETAATTLQATGDTAGADKIRSLGAKWKAGGPLPGVTDATPPAGGNPPGDNPPPPAPPAGDGNATGDGGGNAPDN